MQTNELNQMAVQALLADADHALALTELEDVRGNATIVKETIARARSNYIDLVRRSRPLQFTPAEQALFQQKLDRLRACLRFFGERV